MIWRKLIGNEIIDNRAVKVHRYGRAASAIFAVDLEQMGHRYNKFQLKSDTLEGKK